MPLIGGLRSEPGARDTERTVGDVEVSDADEQRHDPLGQRRDGDQDSHRGHDFGRVAGLAQLPEDEPVQGPSRAAGPRRG